MNHSLALELLENKVKELALSAYHVRYRHLVLKADEVLKINAYNQYFYLTEESPDVSITSDNGFYKYKAYNTNELVFEHTGSIVIENLNRSVSHIRLIQLIPA